MRNEQSTVHERWDSRQNIVEKLQRDGRTCLIMKFVPKSKQSLSNPQPLKFIKVTEPLELVTMDIIEPIMSESKNWNKYIFRMVDY